MKSNKRLKLSLTKFSTKKSNVEEILSGELGIPQNGRKIVEVPNRDGYVYVRLLTNKSELIQALNTSVPAVYNYPVQVRRVKNTYTVIGKTYTRYSNQGSGVGGGVIPLPRHGGQHSLNPDLSMGSDTTWVYSRQFMSMLAYPSGTTSMMLGLSPSFYQYNGQWTYPQVTGVPSFAPYLPTATGSALMALYYLDATDNGLKIIAGSSFSGGISDPTSLAPYIPIPPNNTIPLMAVKLLTGTTALDWSNLYDVRPFFQILPSGTSGGGTGTTTLLNIQDEGIPLGTATTLNFVGTAVAVTISGSVARVNITGSSSGMTIQNHGNTVTGNTVSFDGNVNVSVSGSVISVNSPITTYFRVGQPAPLTGITGAYWKVPDSVYASGSIGVFQNGHALIIGIDYEEQIYVSGTYKYLQTPATGVYHYVHYGVPCYPQSWISTGNPNQLVDSNGVLLTDSNGSLLVDSNG